MKVTQKPSLKDLNTFGLDASAQLLFEIESEEDILSLPVFDPSRDCMLGGGSNVVFLGDVPGNVFLNRIGGVETVREEESRVLIEAGGGENWHRLVRWTVDRGLSGLENLSLIPGSVGAAPVQNIGAYGAELASVTECVTAWDWHNQAWVTFSRDDCLFAYRDSLFKSGETDRYLITSVRLALWRDFKPCLEYAGLRDELENIDSTALTPKAVSDAVIRIRRRKLPDPLQTGNAGSFFKNPVIDAEKALLLKNEFPDLPVWPQNDGTVRISAAWMIESCGLKGKSSGDAAVSEVHALVLINRGAATGRDIATLAEQVQQTVKHRFGLNLEPEPRLIDFA